MDYFAILKKSYQIAIRNRYLWIFGILAGGMGSSFNISVPSNDYSGKLDDFVGNQSFSSWEGIFANYWGVLLAILGLIVLLSFLWAILSIISQASLIGSVRAIAKGEKSNFRIAFFFGLHKFWRVFAIGLIMGLVIVSSLIVLILPVVLFVLSKVYALAIIYGLLFFLIDLVLWIYIAITMPYILRESVLGEKGSWEAITSSWEFFKNHWRDIAVIYLLLLAVGVAFGFALILAILLIGGLLFAVGFALYLASQAVFWMYVAVFGLVFLGFMLTLGGFYTTFGSSVYTLAYLEMVKKS